MLHGNPGLRRQTALASWQVEEECVQACLWVGLSVSTYLHGCGVLMRERSCVSICVLVRPSQRPRTNARTGEHQHVCARMTSLPFLSAQIT